MMRTTSRLLLVALLATMLGLGPARDTARAEALHEAVRRNDTNALAILLAEPGALRRVNEPLAGRVTPLHLAAALNAPGLIRQLLDAGAQPNVRTDTGFTPLHWAAARDGAEAIACLAEAGADINAATDSGITPLHWAAARNGTNAVAVLLQLGASPESRTKARLTPLHWAMSHGSDNVTLALADYMVPDDDTALDGYEAVTPPEFPASAAALDMAQTPPTSIEHPDFSAYAASAFDESEFPAHAVADVDELSLPSAIDADAFLAQSPAPEAPAMPDPTDDDLRAELLPPVTNPPVAEFTAADLAGLAIDPPPPLPVRPTPVTATPPGPMFEIPLGFGEVLKLIKLPALGIWLGKYEITNGQFRRFRPDHTSQFIEQFSLDGGDQPAVNVDWHAAVAFCEWLNQTATDRMPHATRFRLPTVAEWEAAARCGDSRAYPWGERLPPRYGNYSDLTAKRQLPHWRGLGYYEDGHVVSCPVFLSGENEWGLAGMGGNVWEWCDDWHDDARQYKARRGASWDFDGPDSLRVDAMGFDLPDVAQDNIGFRVALVPVKAANRP